MNRYSAIINEKGNIAVDDTLLVKDVAATAGSRILEGFKPLFSAEIVTRLEQKGYTLAGKTHVGEFGLDLMGEFSYYQKSEGAVIGAAASLVAEEKVKAALGVDVNGAPRRAAAISKVCFLKPTYGTVSRYGVISTAASGEQAGVYAKNTAGIKEIMEIIAGNDQKDGTSLPQKSYSYSVNEEVKGKKLCIIKELFDLADDEVKATLKGFAESLKKAGALVETVSCPWILDVATPWQILMCAESCNNVSRYDGVKYGHRAENYRNIDELYVNSRSEGFNLLTKAVILYGSDVLSKNRYKACYDKSLRVRRIMAESFATLMEQYDAALTPCCSKYSYQSYQIEEAFVKVFSEGAFTALANLIGIPALSVGGVQLMGKQFSESLLLSLGFAAESEGK